MFLYITGYIQYGGNMIFTPIKNFLSTALHFFSTKMLIIIGIVILFLSGGGGFAYLKFSAPNTPSNNQTKTQQPATINNETNLPGPIYNLETFIVNLLDDSGRRYLKTNIKLELSQKSVEDEIIQKMPSIQDDIIALLSNKAYEDIADISGKLRLRTQIIKRLNNILTVGKIQKVYFTDFVIQ